MPSHWVIRLHRGDRLNVRLHIAKTIDFQTTAESGWIKTQKSRNLCLFCFRVCLCDVNKEWVFRKKKSTVFTFPLILYILLNRWAVAEKFQFKWLAAVSRCALRYIRSACAAASFERKLCACFNYVFADLASASRRLFYSLLLFLLLFFFVVCLMVLIQLVSCWPCFREKLFLIHYFFRRRSLFPSPWLYRFTQRVSQWYVVACMFVDKEIDYEWQVNFLHFWLWLVGCLIFTHPWRFIELKRSPYFCHKVAEFTQLCIKSFWKLNLRGCFLVRSYYRSRVWFMLKNIFRLKFSAFLK